MLAAYAASIDPDNPLSGLEIGELPDARPPDDDWVVVDVRATALNHHDIWALRGVGLAEEQLPMILGGDAAGLDPDGNEVIVHGVLGDPAAGGGDETLDPRRTLFSEHFHGCLAERVAVPRRNLVAKPAGLSFVEAACLPTAWLTAYRMLTSRGRLPDGGSVLVQGAGGGVASAAIVLAGALAATVYVTSRDAGKLKQAVQLGAVPVEPGARLPERVDVVIDTVGQATLGHSMKALKPGGRCVIAGATSGHLVEVDLRQVFFRQLSLAGSTMGTRAELDAMLALVARKGLRPIVDSTFALADARAAFVRLAAGAAFGKIVLRP